MTPTNNSILTKRCHPNFQHPRTYFAGTPLLRRDSATQKEVFAGLWTSHSLWFRSFLAKILSPDLEHALKVHSSRHEGVVTEFDVDGHVVGTYQDVKGRVARFVSEAQVIDGIMYMGTVHNNFMVKLDMELVKT